jgi:hypothetical protein
MAPEGANPRRVWRKWHKPGGVERRAGSAVGWIPPPAYGRGLGSGPTFRLRRGSTCPPLNPLPQAGGEDLGREGGGRSRRTEHVSRSRLFVRRRGEGTAGAATRGKARPRLDTAPLRLRASARTDTESERGSCGSTLKKSRPTPRSPPACGRGGGGADRQALRSSHLPRATKAVIRIGTRTIERTTLAIIWPTIRW